MRDVILHTFNWQYTDIINHMDEIRVIGYGAILIPPPIYSDPRGDKWWQVYQPKDYRILLCRCGYKEQLEQILQKAHSDIERPIKVYADLVINHMADEDRGDRFYFPGEGELNNYRGDREWFEKNKLYGNLDEGLFSPDDFHMEGKISPEDYAGNRYRVEHFRLGELPDLKPNEWVLKQQRIMIKALVDMGFDGFRIDAAKHLVEEQIDNIVEQPYMIGKFVFGEIIAFNEQEESMYLDLFINRSSASAYDFTLFRTMKGVFEGGSFHKLVDPVKTDDALPWNRAVTFVVNHDLPNNDIFRSSLFKPHEEYLALAYLLGRDGGVPLIYSDHNESAEAHPEDRGRWTSAYNRAGIKSMITFHNAVHGKTMNHLFVDDDVIVFRRGSKGIVAINKSHTERFVNIDTTDLEQGKYRELIHNYEMDLTNNHHFELCVTPREAYLWLKS